MDLQQKQCSKCGAVKPISEFFKRKLNKDGLEGQCKLCQEEKNSKWEKANPVKVQTMYMAYAAKTRAKNKNLAYDIDANYLRSIVTETCPLLEVKLEWSTLRDNGGKLLPNSPSLDRIVPEQGYTKGNVWIVSHRGNMLKSNASPEELRRIAKAVERVLLDIPSVDE
jgi:hypothetical protein